MIISWQNLIYSHLLYLHLFPSFQSHHILMQHPPQLSPQSRPGLPLLPCQNVHLLSSQALTTAAWVSYKANHANMLLADNIFVCYLFQTQILLKRSLLDINFQKDKISDTWLAHRVLIFRKNVCRYTGNNLARLTMGFLVAVFCIPLKRKKI